MSDKAVAKATITVGIVLLVIIELTQDLQWWVWLSLVVISSFTTLAYIMLIDIQDDEKEAEELRFHANLAKKYLEELYPRSQHTWKKTERLDKQMKWERWEWEKKHGKGHNPWKWDDGDARM